jgi:phage tail sheath gpL-like
MAGGATNPDVEQVINAITGVWYTDIVMPWQDSTNLQEMSAELDRRYGAMVHQDGHAYTTITGSYSQQMSKKAAVNGKCVAVFGITNPPTPPWAIAASFAGLCADKLTSDPSRQLKDLVLPGVVGSRPADRRTQQEKELQLLGGICPFHTLSDGTITLVRVVTTYLTNSAGVADPAFHDIMTPKTASRIRYDWKTYTQLIYPRNKLSDDNSIASQYDSTVVTPSRAKASWAARSRVYAQNGWIENTDVLAQQANFVRDPNDRNRLNSTTPVQIIGNAMILADVLQFEV